MYLLNIQDIILYNILYNISLDTLYGCGSAVQPVSCYRKVTGLIPLICMLKCPYTEPQTAPDVLAATTISV